MCWRLQDARCTGSANKGGLLPALVSHFDLVTSFSSSRGGDFEEQLVRHLLDLSPVETAHHSQDRASLKRCLEEHLRRAASTAAPKPSAQALLMMQYYYLVILSPICIRQL